MCVDITSHCLPDVLVSYTPNSAVGCTQYVEYAHSGGSLYDLATVSGGGPPSMMRKLRELQQAPSALAQAMLQGSSIVRHRATLFPLIGMTKGMCTAILIHMHVQATKTFKEVTAAQPELVLREGYQHQGC